jgi:hypothetical protein
MRSGSAGCDGAPREKPGPIVIPALGSGVFGLGGSAASYYVG